MFKFLCRADTHERTCSFPVVGVDKASLIRYCGLREKNRDPKI